MSLINIITKEPTTEELLTLMKNRVKNNSRRIFNNVRQQHTNIFDTIWNNPNGFSPQEVLDEFGTDAVELFTFSLSIQTMLTQADPTYIYLNTPNLYTLNDNGTVTVGDSK